MDQTPEQPTPVRLRELALTFLRIGATGFGGMPALLAMVQEQVVEHRKWVTPEEFSEATAVGQVLPGPIVVDAVAYIGHRLRGWAGAVVCVTCLIAPAFLLMLVLTPLYFHFGHVPRLGDAFRGIGAAVVALIVVACFRLAMSARHDVPSVAIAVAAFLLLTFFQADPILIVLISGAAGLLFCRSNRPSGGKA